jgi:peptide chain release factor subunit 1
VSTSTYHCAETFDTDHLETLLMPSSAYGALVIERGGAALGVTSGDTVTTLATLDSNVMGKHRAGGQSAQRFERDRKRQLDQFFTQVGDLATDVFIIGDDLDVDGLVIGGTTITIDAFRKGGYLDHRLQSALLGTYSVDYSGEQGLTQLVERASPTLADADLAAERDAMDRFQQGLAGQADAPPVTYGVDAVDRACSFGAVDQLLIAETIDTERSDVLTEAVREQGGDVLFISTGFEAGQRLADVFGGVAALLRFDVE